MTVDPSAQSRDRILGRLRATIDRRAAAGRALGAAGPSPGHAQGDDGPSPGHAPGDAEPRPDQPNFAEAPGDFAGERPGPTLLPLDGFTAMFEAAGGEVVYVADTDAAVAWLSDLPGVASVASGTRVPGAVSALWPPADAAAADLGVSMARAAIAETGTLVLDSRDGRRSQLLAPIHVILLRADDLVPTLGDALARLRPDLPSAVGFHSGPSKSADIGQVMVRGVHGPGRVIALVVDDGGSVLKW